MIPFHLVETTTEDKLIHQGLLYHPAKPKKRAILWVHGLTDNFYGHISLLDELAANCEKYGFGFATFNNRGHDMLTSIDRFDKRNPKGRTSITGGSSNEIFKDSVMDIDAGIYFLLNQGYKKILLIGESTGANKACYYAGKKKNPCILGVILASPLSDRLVPQVSDQKMTADTRFMQNLISTGRGEELVLGRYYFPLTPKRFLSLTSSGTDEDTFDYGDLRPKMKYFSKIKIPLLVVFGERDQYADRSVYKIKSVFDEYQKSLSYKSVVLKNALHGYHGHEKEFVNTIMDWSATL